ncbi:MAG: hypothetical protein ABI131_09600 [Nostocoides sp.]
MPVAVVAAPDAAASPSGRRMTGCLLTLSFVLLLVVGVTGPNAASPDLGPRGWAPGSLPGHLSPAVTAVLLTGGYLLGGLGVLAGLRSRSVVPQATWLTGMLAVVGLVTAPFGSADHLNYAAYGRILLQGGDPYAVSPIGWHSGHDPITSHVEAPWMTTPSVYGPFASILQWLTAAGGGDNLRQVVWLWQVVVVLAWLGCRWLLLRIATDRTRVDLLWTVNPVVFGAGVLGAHVDVIATVAALLAIWLALDHPFLAGGAVGLSVCTKVTYAVVGLAVIIAWLRVKDSTGTRRIVGLVIGALVVVVPLHLAFGLEVYGQLGKARRSVSLATPWRLLVELLTGPLSSVVVRNLVFVLAGVMTLVLAWLLARLTRDLAPRSVAGEAMRWTFVFGTAYALAAPYSLPWYDQLAWATLPALAASRLDLVLLGRAVVMAVAYVPGRVSGMTPTVERVTLGFRRHVAPYVGLLAWVAIVALGRGERAQRARRPERLG